MAVNILNGEDVRGLLLFVDDSKQSCLRLMTTYIERLKAMQYTVQTMNFCRLDILQSNSDPDVWFPKETDSRSVVFIHSIELYLQSRGLDIRSFFKEFLAKFLSASVSQVVLSLNKEVTSMDDIRKFEFVASQRLEILSMDSVDEFYVESLWKKPRGKAYVRKEILTFSNSKWKSKIMEEPILKGTPQSKPSLSDLTFKLDISGDEQKAKENLVLPYTEVGSITYTLDKEDDFDEEDDPDDDLEI